MRGVPDIERIATVVRARAPMYADREEPFWEAAVAIALRDRKGATPEVLFIERAVREGDPWSGQVAFPGGRRDDGEADLAETVVREMREETGVDLLVHGELIGPLDEIRPRSPFLPPVIVRPYVARIAGSSSIVLSDEVSSYFWVPLDALLDPANLRQSRVVARGLTMWRDAIHYERHVIWGMTERILSGFSEVIR